MLIIRRKKKKMEKLNLIPILDSVFIFIFFLLMSAQFLQIYEIGSDAPAVKTTDSIKDDKPPLNLTLVISRNAIIIKTGIPQQTYREIASAAGEYDLNALNSTLVEIKQKHRDEKSIIFKPESNVNYRELVKIMDKVREDRTNGNGPEVLFNQIIFETII
jgi:biopolymer transport protein ExbD